MHRKRDVQACGRRRKLHNCTKSVQPSKWHHCKPTVVNNSDQDVSTEEISMCYNINIYKWFITGQRQEISQECRQGHQPGLQPSHKPGHQSCHQPGHQPGHRPGHKPGHQPSHGPKSRGQTGPAAKRSTNSRDTPQKMTPEMTNI